MSGLLNLDWSDLLIAIFVLIIFYRLYVKKSQRISAAVSGPPRLPPICKQDFTVGQLSHYNGVNNERILVAVCGKVFDVTYASNYYGPTGVYSAMAGRDATRALATFDLELISSKFEDWRQLSASEISDAEEWLETFIGKYPFVGCLISDADTPIDYKGESASLAFGDSEGASNE